MKTVIAICALVLAGCFAEPVDIGEPKLASVGPVVSSCRMVVGNSVWAVATFPGRSVDQLASVRAVGHSAIGDPHGAPPGFGYVQLGAFVRDGEVAVNCNAGPVTLPAYDYVIFVP